MRTLILTFLATKMLLLGQQSVEELLLQKLERQLQARAEKTNGLMGVAVIDLKTGQQVCVHCGTLFPTASTIKVPILVELLTRDEAGTLRLADVVPVKVEEAVPGSRAFEAAAKATGKMTLHDLATVMIRDSDNGATNKLIGILGMDAVNARMEQLGLGTEIRLRRTMIDLQAGRQGRENVASPRAMARLAAQLEAGRVVSTAVSQKALAYMLLVKGGMREAMEPGVEVPVKTGSLLGVECEMGIVRLPGRPFALAVYTAYLEEPNPLAEITKMVAETFRKLAKANAAGRFL